MDRAGTKLGACLNEVLERSKAPLVAKWDDDDWYGPEYLADLVATQQATAAAVAGKHSYFAYLDGSDETIVRFPRHDFRDCSFLAGGTLLIDRAALGNIRFPDVNLGEDRALLAACVDAGLRVFASDPFSYVQLRGATNTWSIDDRDFARGALHIGPGLQLGRAYV